MTDQRVQTWLHGGDQLPVSGQDKNTAGTDLIQNSCAPLQVNPILIDRRENFSI